MLTREEQFYETAATELAEDNLIQATWGKAFTLALGDEPKTKALYMKLRVEQLEREFQETLYESISVVKHEINNGDKFTCPCCHCVTTAKWKRINGSWVTVFVYYCVNCKNELLQAGVPKGIKPGAQSKDIAARQEVSLLQPLASNEAKSNNGFAATGFILGLASMPLYAIGIIPILAVIFSIIGLATFDEEKQKNRWMAGVGLALGVVFTIMTLSQASPNSKPSQSTYNPNSYPMNQYKQNYNSKW